MEPISLSISAVALATLFRTCLESFEYFQTAKSFSNDFELLILKLDCQKEKLLTWGEIVGITKTIPEGRDPELDSPKSELITRCLTSIASLLSDTEKLQKEYGVEATTASFRAENYPDYLTSNRMNQFRKSYLRLAPSSSRQSQPNILLKTKWAIHHKTKFETLIYHIKELVINLHDILPVPARSQEKLVHKDIASLSVSRLRQVQKACEGVYQTWSDVASAIVMASETGTIDRRSVGEWLQDTNDTENEIAETAASPDALNKSYVSQKGFDLRVSPFTTFYFVFTSRCFSNDSGNDSETRCDQRTLGFMSLREEGQSFLPGKGTSLGSQGKLGHRITKSMNAKFSDEDLEMLRQTNYEHSDFQNAALLGNVYVYCAPCACAVRTALIICADGSSEYLPYVVRVDDRISASCCPESTKLDRLISLLTTIKEIEAGVALKTTVFNTRWIGCIDRVWIEQRMYRLEEELYAEGVPRFPRSPTARGEELLAEFRGEGKNIGVVFLGELDHCFWMLQTRPFPWKARIPKETEIYKLNMTRDPSTWDRIYLGTYTPRTFRAYTSYPMSASFLDLPTKENTNDSVGTRSESSEFSPRYKRARTSQTNGIEDSEKIQNRQLAANTASSASQMDTED